jgi:predicted RNA-binding Zn ribbon-like protein
LLHEPLPIELHNTQYAQRGSARDGIADADGLRAWLGAMAGDLPVTAADVDARRLAEFHALRAAVRAALHARIAGAAIPARARRALNAASAAAPRSLQLDADGSGRMRHHAADATTALLAQIAAETIALVGGERARDLRTCGAPGCVLVFVKDHPRRAWCSPACGNRVRQARHYARRRL